MRKKSIALVATLIAVVGGLLLFDQHQDRTRVKGLKIACFPLVPVGITGFCTHGPDPHIEVCVIPLDSCILDRLRGSPSPSPTPTPTVSPTPSPSPTPTPLPGCVGDGRSGKRIHLFYGYTGESRYAEASPHIKESAAKADAYLAASSAGVYRYRFLCDTTGIVVTPIKISSRDLTAFVNAARTAGHDRTDRVYSAMGEFDGSGGGTATLEGDDSPGLSNRNNTGPAYSWTGAAWNWTTLMHEIGHNLGAVQMSAPHSSGGWHCWDEYDIMCYDDGGSKIPPGGMQFICPREPNQWDCRDDDYWAVDPSAGSYLATHWNLVRSEFLSTR